MKLVRNFSLLSLLVIFLIGCRKEEIPSLSLGIRDTYFGTRLQPVQVVCGLDKGEYEWRWVSFSSDAKRETKDVVVSNRQNYVAVLDEVGEYRFEFTYREGKEVIKKSFTINIKEEIVNYSPYIADVLEYVPAPGRYINSYLGFFENSPNSYDEVLARCKTIICGSKINKAISLGGFGGYVIFAFDHTVINVPDSPDFEIYSEIHLSGGVTPSQQEYANSAPGVVWVAFDANNNGKPDEDEWYELYNPMDEKNPLKLVRNYKITYSQNTNPLAYAGERLDSANARDYKIPEHIVWSAQFEDPAQEAELGSKRSKTGGFLPKMKFDIYDPKAPIQYMNRDYWPLWRKDQSSLTFEGTLLADNGEEEWGKVSENGKEYLQVNSKRWVVRGDYAANRKENIFDINYAIDREGNRVNLPGIQFVKVQTGVNLQMGHIGGLCTELKGAIDLHLKR